MRQREFLGLLGVAMAASPFLGKGYRVIAHDRRGHGRSAQVSDGHDLDHYAADVAAAQAAVAQAQAQAGASAATVGENGSTAQAQAAGAQAADAAIESLRP